MQVGSSGTLLNQRFRGTESRLSCQLDLDLETSVDDKGDSTDHARGCSEHQKIAYTRANMRDGGGGREGCAGDYRSALGAGVACAFGDLQAIDPAP